MSGYTDDTRVQELLAPLARIEQLAFAGSVPPERRRLRRPVLVAAIVVVGLAVTGVAIANGLGVFNGFNRARPVILDHKVKAAIRADCRRSRMPRKMRPPGVPPLYNPFCHLVLSSARLLDRSPRLYAFADTRGEICTWGSIYICSPPLSRKQPITFGGGNPARMFFAAGLAIDGVTSVSFKVWNHAVTVPVRHNVWTYERPHSTAGTATCIVAHMADGSKVKPFPEVPCR